MIFGNPWLSEDITLFIIISVLLILAFYFFLPSRDPEIFDGDYPVAKKV
jgi:hypothetical protein